MEEKVKKIEQDIRKTMKDAKEWEMKKTSIPGIFLVRMPGKEFRVMLEFFPTDDEGNGLKKRGYYFGEMEILKAARAAFLDDKLDSLVIAIESIRGPRGGRSDGETFVV